MAETVRVRMYNVGFGDCFLLEFPREDLPPFRVLVDCGSHTAGYPSAKWKPEDVVLQLIADVTDEKRGAAIDVVVASHRHQDHVSGFRSPLWKGVTVGEVWMPWTENPNDPRATEIRDRQSRLALGLNLAFKQQAFDNRWMSSDVKQSLQSIAGNSLTNEAAMRTLHRGFAGRPSRKFLASRRKALTIAGCPGLAVHVLGPSREESVIRDMDPPTGQSYLRFIAPALDGGATASPTSRHTEYRSTGPFARNLTISPLTYENDPDLREPLAADVKAAATAMMRDDDIATAVALDKAVNGTSLMLVFEFGKAFLLFPGDAQWGTWNAALSEAKARDVLSRTTFYKVGHHGSHNATPVEFVQNVLNPEEKIWGSAASVRPVGMWPQIPRIPLLDELKQRSSRLVRSDRPGRSRSGYTVRPGVGVDFRVPF